MSPSFLNRHPFGIVREVQSGTVRVHLTLRNNRTGQKMGPRSTRTDLQSLRCRRTSLVVPRRPILWSSLPKGPVRLRPSDGPRVNFHVTLTLQVFLSPRPVPPRPDFRVDGPSDSTPKRTGVLQFRRNSTLTR